MTITFLAPDGVAITAKQERQANAALHGGGYGRPLGGRSGFRVDTPSDVFTATSTTWTLKPCTAMIDPGASTHQGMYGWATDADVTGAVTASDATYARKDIAYIQINDSSAGDGSGALSAPVLYAAGVPGADPQPPALPPRSFLVATITVPQTGGGSPSVVLNPARFVAAGARLPVGSAAERPSAPHVGQEVLRTDRNNHVQRWNGTAWKWVSEPERYVERANVFDSTLSSSSMAIRTMPSSVIPTRSYATQIKVRSMATISTDAINTGAMRIIFGASVGVSQVGDAQGKCYMSFTNPGGYFETGYVETVWLPLGAGANPLIRNWVERIVTSTVKTQVASAPIGSGFLEALVLPADD